MSYSWTPYLALSGLGQFAETDIDLFQAALITHALNEGLTLRNAFFGNMNRVWETDSVEGLKILQDLLSGFEGHIVLDISDESSVWHCWVWGEGFAQIKVEGDTPSIHYIGFCRDQEEALGAWVAKHTRHQPPVEKPGNDIHALMKQPLRGYRISKLGRIDAPLVRENYSSEVLDAFDFTLQELNRDDPHGRITIMDGPPGTGKTWLIRAIIHACTDATFVIVPPDMIKDLGKPEFLPMFLEERPDDGPLVLILEDADEMMSERMAGSMGTITAALNIGDGILGEALNIRLICSTNQKITEIDAAMRRPGRLSRRIEVKGLPWKQATKLFKAKGGLGKLGEYLDVQEVPDMVTLATVYETVKVSREK